MARRKSFILGAIPHADEFQPGRFNAPDSVLNELESLTSEVMLRSYLAQEFLARRPPGPVSWTEVEAWLHKKEAVNSPKKEAKQYLNLVLQGRTREACRYAKEAFLAAHPTRLARPGRPNLSGSVGRRQAILGITLGLLLEEGGERLRKRLAEETEARRDTAAA